MSSEPPYPAEKIKEVKKILKRDFPFLIEINIHKIIGKNRTAITFHYQHAGQSKYKCELAIDAYNPIYTPKDIAVRAGIEFRRCGDCRDIMQTMMDKLSRELKAKEEFEESIKKRKEAEIAQRNLEYQMKMEIEKRRAMLERAAHYEQEKNYGIF